MVCRAPQAALPIYLMEPGQGGYDLHAHPSLMKGIMRQPVRGEASVAKVRSNRVAHRGQAARSVYALAALLLLGLLAGCGSSTQGADRSGSTPTVTASPRDNETPTATASANWATYMNTKYGYTIEYPTEWFPLDTSPTAGNFIVYSYDSSKVSGYPLLDGATKIEIFTYPNPSQLSPADVLQQVLDQRTQRGEPIGPITKQSVTVAGQPSLEVIEGPHTGPFSGNTYSITYMFPCGAVMLAVNQFWLPSGAPSAVLTHMVQSLTLTGA
jgi:hypothetical protein